MGKGDIKSKKGKRAAGSYGKSRKRKADSVVIPVKKETTKKEPAKKKTATKTTKTASKKTSAKKTATKKDKK